jgi:dolichyl-phosphate-mannose--protein O-mannosyl transferase
LLTGLLLGVSLATKWTAVFFILGLMFFEVITIFKTKNFKLLPLTIFSLLVLPIFIYILGYAPVLFSGKSLSFLIDLHKNIFYYQFNRDSLHLYQSLPWQWILNIRPVWYWTNGETQNIYLLNNPLLVVFYLLSLGVVIYQVVKNEKSLPVTYLLFFYILSWSGWLVSPRILFYYHYLPAIPFLAVITAIVMKNLYFNNKSQGMFLFLFNIFLLITFFWLYYPVWIGLPVSQDLYQALYLLLPSWK